MQIVMRAWLLLAGALLMLAGQRILMHEREQVIFMVLSFVLFGIPHGALDLFIEKGLDGRMDLRKVFFRYVLMAALYIGLWYFNPPVALIIFILITAFHFGEIDWMGRRDGATRKLFYFLTGLCWILFLLSHHLEEALGIFDAITRRAVSKNLFSSFAGFLMPASLTGLVLLTAFSFFFRNALFLRSRHWYLVLAQQAALLLMALYTPLWIFFAFYFGIWHSLLSLDKIRSHFRLGNTLHDWLFLLRKALPFSVLAWLGILYFILLTSRIDDASGMLSLVFVGLAVLTVPHLHVFARLGNPSDH